MSIRIADKINGVALSAPRFRLRKRLSDGLILPAAARRSRRPLLGINNTGKRRQGTAWLFWLMTVGG